MARSRVARPMRKTRPPWPRSLRDQGLIPTSIEAGGSAATGKRKARQGGKGGKIKLEDLVIMTRQYATMIRAGLPLLEVLNILGDQTEKRALKLVMKQVERDVETGSSLAEAMQKHPKVFNTFYQSMIMAGEAAGMLDTILDQVATYLEKSGLHSAQGQIGGDVSVGRQHRRPRHHGLSVDQGGSRFLWNFHRHGRQTAPADAHHGRPFQLPSGTLPHRLDDDRRHWFRDLHGW